MSKFCRHVLAVETACGDNLCAVAGVLDAKVYAPPRTTVGDGS